MTAILGIIATVNGRTAVTGISEVDWGALTGLIIMLAGGGLIGLVIYKYRRIKTKHLKLTDIMNLISDILFWISNGLLVPVVVLLIILFIRSLLL